MVNAELTAKQARFVQEYLVDGNGAGAAVRAGYGVGGAKVAACRLLTRDNVQKAVQARQAADATRLSLRREDVLKGLLEAVDQARVQSNPMGMIAGLRELARLMGFYPDPKARLDATVAVTGNVDMDRLSRLSDAELLKIIAAGTATVAC
jgi:phage terminase small subunit